MNFSSITDTLFVGSTPNTQDYDALRELGVHLVLNMRQERRPRRDLHNPPMPTLWLPTFDSPLLPIPIRALHKGVKAALATLSQGGKVYAHCAAGVHRGVAMGAAILIAQGYTAESAMQLLTERRLIADPNIWYIRRRILRFADMWSKENS